MSKLMARVRGRTFQVTDSWNKQQLTDALNQFNRGGFVICPDCNRLDIDPYTHFSQCDPVAEQSRQEAQEHSWA